MTTEFVAGPEAPTARIRIPQHVVHRPFAHETVVLNLESGQYHGLNPTAGQILAELERTGTVEATVAAMAAQHDVGVEQLRQDVNALCVSLAERGLIEIDGKLATE
jgi:hypothetical protein